MTSTGCAGLCNRNTRLFKFPPWLNIDGMDDSVLVDLCLEPLPSEDSGAAYGRRETFGHESLVGGHANGPPSHVDGSTVRH